MKFFKAIAADTILWRSTCRKFFGFTNDDLKDEEHNAGCALPKFAKIKCFKSTSQFAFTNRAILANFTFNFDTIRCEKWFCAHRVNLGENAQIYRKFEKMTIRYTSAGFVRAV